MTIEKESSEEQSNEGSTARTGAPASEVLPPLTREEVAAIWLFPEDYAAQKEHARIWYGGLSLHAKRSVGQFLWAIDEAGR